MKLSKSLSYSLLTMKKLLLRTVGIWSLAVWLIAVQLLTAFGLAEPVKATSPKFDVLFVVRDETERGLFTDTVSFPAGHRLTFRIFLRNSQLATKAPETRLKVDLPQGAFTGAPATLIVFATDGTTAQAQVSLNVTTAGGAVLSYVPGSTRVTWDVNNDGRREFISSLWADGITSNSGVVLGDMTGCDITFCKAEIRFSVDSVTGNAPAPNVPRLAQATVQTPIPTPIPTPSPTPATTSAGTLPKTGAAQSIIAILALSLAVIIGWRLKFFAFLSLKHFALPIAIKVSKGQELSAYDLLINRKLIRRSS